MINVYSKDSYQINGLYTYLYYTLNLKGIIPQNNLADMGDKQMGKILGKI